MQKYPIIALVGTSGGGKTALLLEILKRYPDLCAPIKSKVTRPQRNEKDGIFYDFLTRVEFQAMLASGRIFQSAHFGGHDYGCDRVQTDAVVANKIGLTVLVQQSIADFRAAGYKLHVVHIVPEGHRPRDEAERIKDDAERAKIELEYDTTIVNSFARGGFERAADELAAVVTNIYATHHSMLH